MALYDMLEATPPDYATLNLMQGIATGSGRAGENQETPLSLYL